MPRGSVGRLLLGKPESSLWNFHLDNMKDSEKF